MQSVEVSSNNRLADIGPTQVYAPFDNLHKHKPHSMYMYIDYSRQINLL